MKVIGLVIAIILVSLFFVWWMDLSLSSTKKAITTTGQIEESRSDQVPSGFGPLDYSKQRADEFNEASEERAKEINQLP